MSAWCVDRIAWGSRLEAFFEVDALTFLNDGAGKILIPAYCIADTGPADRLIVWLLDPAGPSFTEWDRYVGDAGSPFTYIYGTGGLVAGVPRWITAQGSGDAFNGVYEYTSGPPPSLVVALANSNGDGNLRTLSDGTMYFSDSDSITGPVYRRINPDFSIDTLTYVPDFWAGQGTGFDIDAPNDRLVIGDRYFDTVASERHGKLVAYDLTADTFADLVADLPAAFPSLLCAHPAPAGFGGATLAVRDLAMRSTGEIAVVLSQYDNDAFSTFETLALISGDGSTLNGSVALGYNGGALRDGNHFPLVFDPVNDGWWYGFFPRAATTFMAEIWFVDASTMTATHVATMPAAA